MFVSFVDPYVGLTRPGFLSTKDTKSTKSDCRLERKSQHSELSGRFETEGRKGREEAVALVRLSGHSIVKKTR